VPNPRKLQSLARKTPIRDQPTFISFHKLIDCWCQARCQTPAADGCVRIPDSFLDCQLKVNDLSNRTSVCLLEPAVERVAYCLCFGCATQSNPGITQFSLEEKMYTSSLLMVRILHPCDCHGQEGLGYSACGGSLSKTNTRVEINSISVRMGLLCWNYPFISKRARQCWTLGYRVRRSCFSETHMFSLNTNHKAPEFRMTINCPAGLASFAYRRQCPGHGV
jgi:hypothetical protein